MPRLTQQEIYQSLVDALPADGSPILYEDFHAQLLAAGNKDALAYLQQAKATGDIKTSLEFDENGLNQRHMIRRVVS